jgi:hypothetical protein
MVAAQQPPHISSGIQILIAGVQRSVADLRVPILLVLLQILVVTLVVLAGVGVLLVSRQSFELGVLHSRGFTARTLLLAQGIQALLAAVLALPIGIAIGAVLARFAGLTNGPRPGTRGSPPACRSARSRSARPLRRRARWCCGSRRSRPSVERSSTNDVRPPGRHALHWRAPRSSSSSCPWDSSRSRSSATGRRSRQLPPARDRSTPPAVRADARDPRCVLPGDPHPVVGTRIARREDRTVPPALDLPGGPPTRTSAGGGLRVGGSGGAGHRVALHLDDLPGDDAAEPRGRGARVRLAPTGWPRWGVPPTGRSHSTGHCRPAWPTWLGCSPMGSRGRTRTRRRASRSIPRPSARQPGGGPTSRRIPSTGCSIVSRPRPRG